MKKYLLLSAIALPLLGYSQWTKVSQVSDRQKVNESVAYLAKKNLFSLDQQKLQSLLSPVNNKFSGKQGVVITIPNSEGKLERFKIWEYSNMAEDLQAKFPDIKSYVGISLDDASAYLRFSLSPQGLSSIIVRSGHSEYIEPLTADHKTYVVFDSSQKKKNVNEDEPFECAVKDAGSTAEETPNVSNKAAGTNVFRLALSCTGEYAQYHLDKAGIPSTATDAEKKAVVLAAINATATRLNALFEKDLSLHYNLISQTESLIFLNANTDPYSSGGGPDTANSGINSTLGTGAASLYDLGHLVDKKDANGAAYLGVICGSSLKAGGWTSHNLPEGATFDIDYVAHEMGHQMGAGHTYTFYSSQLDQRVEPGSGSTVMAYTGITGNLDVQYNSHDNFHYNSLNQIKNKINGVSCGTNVPYALPAPTVDAGNDYTIPASTPFVVKATTTDASTTGYTYSFEQTDQAATAQIGTNSIAYLAKPSGPNFRALPPTANPYRYFPDFNTVLAGVYTTRWESVSSVARTLNFGVVVRNNNPLEPNIARDAMAVTVNAASGPFKVTAPTFGQSLTSGGSFTVTWDVANTNVAPVNTTTVNLKISKDGGKTFVSLLDNTPNDGTETVTIPSDFSATNAYILVEAVNNIYYAVSPSFVIDYSVAGEECNTYTYSGAPVNIKDGPGGSAIASPKVEAPLSITDTGVITKISVTPNITHPNAANLSFGIESPVGTTALLMDHQCSSRSGITAKFTDAATTITCASPVTGNAKPFQPLNVFVGHNAEGTWKLFASDNTPGNVGVINSWALEVCTRDAQVLAVNENAFNANNIKVYPNPSSGNFFIKSKDLGSNANVAIYDMNGRVVHTSGFNAATGESTNEFNVNLTKGVYLLKVTSSKANYTQKLIVK